MQHAMAKAHYAVVISWRWVVKSIHKHGTLEINIIRKPVQVTAYFYVNDHSMVYY